MEGSPPSAPPPPPPLATLLSIIYNHRVFARNQIVSKMQKQQYEIINRVFVRNQKQQYEINISNSAGRTRYISLSHDYCCLSFKLLLLEQN